MRYPRAPRAPEEKKSGDDQDRTASELVRERPREESSDGAAKEERRHVEPGAEVGGMKGPVERVHGPIDDAAVETKKKTTERRYC
jgi:hypothetical protein